MNNDENLNNQRGVNGTASFNAYNAQKNAARLNGQNLGNAALNGPTGDIAKKALSTMGPQGKIASKALDVAQKVNKAKQSADASEASEGVEGAEGEGAKEQAKPNTNPLSSLPSKVDDATSTADKIKNFKKKLRIYGIIAGIAGFFALIITVVVLFDASLIAINEFVGEVKTFFDKTGNLLTLKGFGTDYENMQENIKNAANDNDFLDVGILYAMANNGVVYGSEMFEEGNEDTEDAISDSLNDYASETMNTGTFYRKKETLLGTPARPGTAINVLIGRELSYKCHIFTEDENVESLKKELRRKNKSVTASYVGSKLVTVVKEMGYNVLDFVTGIVNPIGTTIQLFEDISDLESDNYSTFLTSIEQKIFDVKYTPGIIESFSAHAAESDECIANGGYPVYEAYKINDYKTLYAYVSNIYTPVMYSKVWNTLSEDTQRNLIKETWADIVMVRNDYYAALGENNFLGYYFDEYGEIVTTLGAGAVYISNIPTDADAAIAFDWRQGSRPKLGINTPWSTIPLGIEGDTMDNSGCLVTSVAKLMKLSGTQINSPTFDPGTLARNASFTNGGGLIYSVRGKQKSWYNLAPNFYYVATKPTSISVDSSNLAGQVAGVINNAVATLGLDMNKCYFTVQIGSTAMPTHFVAVVGSDESGIIVSDPAVYRGENTYHLKDIRTKYSKSGHPDLDVIAIQVYLKTD